MLESTSKSANHNPKRNDNQGQSKDKPTGPVCYYCKKPGHLMSDCYTIKRRQEKQAKPNALVHSHKGTPFVETVTPQFFSPSSKEETGDLSDSVREEYLPFVSKGFVSTQGDADPVPITILRDTGATQTLLLDETLGSFGESTRFPEAIPLRNIKASSVSKALIKFFTLFGLPKEIQSDQGSNFMSGLFQQVICQLGAKQITSTAYHPESQGALERFHSIFENWI